MTELWAGPGPTSSAVIASTCRARHMLAILRVCSSKRFCLLRLIFALLVCA